MLNKMSRKYRKRDEVLLRTIAGENLLIPIRSKLADLQRVFALNSLGAEIWARLDGRQDLQQILRDIQEHCDVAPDQASHDLMDFVNDLLAADLVVEAP